MTAKIADHDARTSQVNQFAVVTARPTGNVINCHLTGGGHEKFLILQTLYHKSARRNQIFKPSSENETVLGSSRKLREAAEYLIDGSAKRICRLSFEF